MGEPPSTAQLAARAPRFRIFVQDDSGTTDLARLQAASRNFFVEFCVTDAVPGFELLGAVRPLRLARVPGFLKGDHDVRHPPNTGKKNPNT
jgi:hypothetical protein